MQRYLDLKKSIGSDYAHWRPSGMARDSVQDLYTSFWITDSRMRDSVIEPFLVQNRYFLLRSLVYW
jgi:hypothetical protein